MFLVDANIILDIWYRDPVWEPWSRSALFQLLGLDEGAINPIIYAEVSTRYQTRAEVDQALDILQLDIEEIPREAAFLAGQAFLRYRKQGGTKINVLPDFFIAAHAAVRGWPLLTRDATRHSTYFPTVRLITPA